MKYRFLLAVLVLVGMIGCKGSPKVSDQDLQQIEYPKLLELRESPKLTVVIVDVRSAAQYAQGHLPNAIHIPLAELDYRDARLGNADAVVVYAGGWTEFLSPAAAKKLLAMGYKNIYDFRGGIEIWKAYGGKLTTPQK